MKQISTCIPLIDQVILIGRMQHVLDAFDIISELLYTMHAHNITSPTFLMQLLIEHNKAGKIIGNKVTIFKVYSL